MFKYFDILIMNGHENDTLGSIEIFIILFMLLKNNFIPWKKYKRKYFLFIYIKRKWRKDFKSLNTVNSFYKNSYTLYVY